MGFFMLMKYLPSHLTGYFGVARSKEGAIEMTERTLEEV